MQLAALLGALSPGIVARATPDIEIADVAYDSRRVVPGTLFVCVRGEHHDGHDHAAAAVERGAVALVCERELALAVPQVVVADARATMPPLAVAFFGDPTATLRVAGVTGTNGKTTTTFLVRSILEADGTRCGLIGTVEQRVGGASEPIERTTPEAIDLQRAFRRMLDAGDRACAMEVSSHALELGRVDGVRFAAAAFTNLTHEHLDFHGSMERYFAAKARLFDGRCPRAVNVDDDHGRRLAAEITFAVAAQADVGASDVTLGADATSYTLRTPRGSARCRSPLVGAFNVANALAAASTALLLDVPLASIVRGIERMSGVPGRMERVDAGQPFTVLVDYAHKPDALVAVLEAARGFCSGRLHVVVGCGGDRDRAKRPLMGRAASTLADHAIVTSDNPRSEDPEAIIAEIVSGAVRAVEVEPDRRAAIRRAIAAATAGDVVVIAGKGHEQGQEARGVKLPFDDRVVAREALA